MRKLFYKGARVPDEASKVCVLFDPQQRRIVHIHGSTTLAGQAPPETDLEAAARKHAESFGHDASRLKAAYVPASAVRAGGGLVVSESGDGVVQTGGGSSRRAAWNKIRQMLK